MKIKPLRDPLVIGSVKFSAQASAFHYSHPREDEGPYTHIEIALISASAKKSDWFRPSDFGLTDIEERWESFTYSPVGAYIPLADAQRLADAIAAQEGVPAPDVATYINGPTL